MKRHTPIVLALALSLALAGCIQNMGDLKGRLSGDADEPVQAATTDDATTPPTVETPVANATPKKAPVARMSLFAASGALVYKSTFQADDPAEIVFVEEKSKLNAIAGDSETLEKGATLSSYAWTLNGKAISSEAKATVEVGEAGLYTLVLTVTDSNQQTDVHTVKLGVAPKPYDVVTELMTGAVLGASGLGQTGELTFDLALDTSTGPTTIQAVTFTASPGLTCDAQLDVLDANGESVGSADDGGNGGAEEIAAGALPVGAYTIIVSAYACVEPEGVPVTVTVTYLPVIEGVDAGDGHGAHAGH